jgi:hypothetical protein
MPCAATRTRSEHLSVISDLQAARRSGTPVAIRCTMHLSASPWAQQPRDGRAWRLADVQLVAGRCLPVTAVGMQCSRAVSLDCTRLRCDSCPALTAALPMDLDHGPWTMDHGSAGVDQAVWLLGEGRPDQNHAGGARILLGLGMHPQLGRRGLFIFTAAGAGARVESAG